MIVFNSYALARSISRQSTGIVFTIIWRINEPSYTSRGRILTTCAMSMLKIDRNANSNDGVNEELISYTVFPLLFGLIIITLRPRQNGCQFPDAIFKCIFLNENIKISIKISLKFVPKGPINNIPSLVQIMAWRRPGDKPSSEPMMVCLLTHICVTRPQWVKRRIHAFLCYQKTTMWCEMSLIEVKLQTRATRLQILWLTNSLTRRKCS